jgi:hypothetical protein
MDPLTVGRACHYCRGLHVQRSVDQRLHNNYLRLLTVGRIDLGQQTKETAGPADWTMPHVGGYIPCVDEC